MNLPTSRAEQLRAAHGLEAELTQRLGRAPTLQEMAYALGRSEDWTSALLAHQHPQSLELVDGGTLDRLHALDELDSVLSEPVPVQELLLRLDDLDRRVLELRLGFDDGGRGHSVHTARVLQISVTRVRRIEARALDTLRAASARGGPQFIDRSGVPRRAQWPRGEQNRASFGLVVAQSWLA